MSVLTNPFQHNENHKLACWYTELAIPEKGMAFFVDALSDVADSLTYDTETLTLYFEHEPDINNLKQRIDILAEVIGINTPNVTLKKQKAMDWAEETQKDFEPFTVGEFHIHPLSYKEVPHNSKSIALDPAASFGTGTHATTQSCLEALYQLKEHSLNTMLDMGCGSGILALMMAHLWKKTVIAVDYDPYAVNITEANAKRNNVNHLIQTAVSNGYQSPVVQQQTYDLIASNLLANLLVIFAPDLTKHLNNGGYAILSGMLTEQEEEVLTAHTAAGLTLVDTLRNNGWSTLVLRK